MELTVSSESGNMTSLQAKLYSPRFSVHSTAILSANTSVQLKDIVLFLHEMSNFNRGPSTDATSQVSVHLAQRFETRRFLRNQPIRNKNCLWRPCLLTDRDEINNLYRGPSIDASYQVSVRLAKLFETRRCFRNQPIRNKNCLWHVTAMFANGSRRNEQSL
jgi:hypothetical protein